MKYLEEAQTVILQAGIRRSGNHGIMNWIGGLFDGMAVLNNGSLKVTHYVADGVFHRIGAYEKREMLSKGCSFSAQAVLYGVEDTPVDQIWHKQRFAQKAPKADVKRVIILRDPFNNLASIINHFCLGDAGYCRYDNGRFGVLWAEYAREAIEFSQGPALVIDYNRWATSEKYRRGLAKELGRPFDDRGFDHVPKIARGSSFDYNKVADQAFRQRVLQRYLRCLEDDELAYRFWVGLNNEALWAAAMKLYPRETTEVSDLLQPDKERQWKNRWMATFQ